ncbi:MAG TPA: condensation domain-containing protein, partial [Candidatus Deferrimicrobium sp.]|nr:condensation domain-containing protein [Candidatus Deferrimicrobium sp.]
QLVLTDKETILDAHRLAGTLRGNHINTFWLSSSLFNQLTQENIELFSSLKYLLVGGDVLSPAHVNRVKRRFPGLSIINGYGPTENTTFSTTYLIAEEFEQNIPIGSPIANSTTYIIDRYGHLQPVGICGELAVGGDGIALGYLNNPELTTERFVNFHHSKLYCTGDLARWNENGIIEFLGRLDHQVKIRGFRVELGEIESYLLKFGKIKEAVVIPVGGALGDKTLAAYVVPDSEISFAVNELREYLQTVLPGYMIPAYIVVMEKLPLTLNGKIDRRLLPVPGLNIGEKYVAPRDEAEKRVASIWSEILGVRQEIIGIEDNFFELGGQSLKATLMASRIQREFKVTLPLAEIFKRPTVKGLTEFIRKTITGVFMPVEMALRRDYYALSASQRRMYLLYRLDENSTAYNMPAVLSLAGKLEISRFEAVIRKLIQRHEGFRTSFELLNEEAVQKVHENVAFEIELLGELLGDRQEKNSSFIIRHFIRAFDLSKAPLLRVGFLKQEEDKYLLMVDMHHIISDGMSLGIFVREFMALYVDKDLPALGLQYKDYAQWQQSEGVREILKSQEQYWLEQFETEIPVLNLPTDFVRPKVQSFEGRSIACEIGPGETMELKKLALEQNTTLYMVLLAVFGIFLAKLSGQEDIVMGTPTAGRRHVELESIIGMFVNTLALRHFPQGEKSFAQFLGEVTGRTLAAFENQDYPFEDLVEKVVQNRDMGRNPIFDVMFALQNIEIPDIAVPGLKLTPYHYESGTAKFDITLNGIVNGEGLHFDFEYSSKLFEEITIRRFINFFKKIITIVPANPAVKLAALEIISEEERKQVLVEFNDTDKTYPAYKDISVLFEEQAEKTPDRIALIVAAKGEEKNVGADLCVCPASLTYRQLNEQSGL